jgi:hypothetical protein
MTGPAGYIVRRRRARKSAASESGSVMAASNVCRSGFHDRSLERRLGALVADVGLEAQGGSEMMLPRLAGRERGGRDMKWSAIVAAAVLGTVLVSTSVAGCHRAGDDVTVAVLVRVTTCVDGGKRCFALGLPEADVTMVLAEGETIASGTTDDSGEIRFTIDPLGQEADIIAASPLFMEGRADSTVMLPVEGDSIVSVTLQGRLATDAAEAS